MASKALPLIALAGSVALLMSRKKKKKTKDEIVASGEESGQKWRVIFSPKRDRSYFIDMLIDGEWKDLGEIMGNPAVFETQENAVIYAKDWAQTV